MHCNKYYMRYIHRKGIPLLVFRLDWIGYTLMHLLNKGNNKITMTLHMHNLKNCNLNITKGFFDTKISMEGDRWHNYIISKWRYVNSNYVNICKMLLCGTILENTKKYTHVNMCVWTYISWFVVSAKSRRINQSLLQACQFDFVQFHVFYFLNSFKCVVKRWIRKDIMSQWMVKV